MGELPAEAPVDDEEAFASSAEDDNEEPDQEQHAALLMFKAETFEVETTNSEEVDEEAPRGQACPQTGHEELPERQSTREPKSRNPSKTQEKSQVTRHKILVLVGALRDRRQRPLRGLERRKARTTKKRCSRTRRAEEQWNS